jgi:TrmH family RNA methyltransferase
VLDALQAKVDVLTVFVEPGLDEHVVDEIIAAGVDVHRVPAGALASALDTTTPQPVAAIVRREDVSADAAIAAAGSMALVLVGVADPGNAGTLLRTAEAAGAGAVLFCDGSVDPYNPKCVRASAGSLFRVGVMTGGEAVDVLERTGSAGMTRIATSLLEGTAPEALDLTVPFALVLGNEAHGLPAALDGYVDASIRLPMAGRVESLNVAMAGTAICFEALRQRRAS